MKKVLLVVLILMFSVNAYAGVLTTEAKTQLNNFKAEILREIPNNQKTINLEYNAEVVDSEEYIAKYTDSQWLDEIVKANLIRIIRKGNKKLTLDAMVAKDTSTL